MQRLLVHCPLFASGFPGEFVLPIRIETLQHRKALWIIIVKPAGKIDPIPIVAGMHGAELHVKVPGMERGLRGAREESEADIC